MSSRQDDRQARLTEALRANLRRRKAQARAVATPPTAPAGDAEREETGDTKAGPAASTDGREM